MIDKAVLFLLYIVLVVCIFGYIGVKFNYAYDEDTAEMSISVKFPQVDEYAKEIVLNEECEL